MNLLGAIALGAGGIHFTRYKQVTYELIPSTVHLKRVSENAGERGIASFLTPA